MKKKTGYSIAGIIIAISIAAFIAIATFIVIDGNNKSTDFSSYDFNSVIQADSHNGEISDHIKGYDPATGTVTDDPEIAKKAPLIIYEYADFQCEYCALMNTRVNNLIKKLEGKVSVVYRNYLLSYHQNGTAAASAAEAASLQGYWKPYADKLYENQSEWAYSTGSNRTDLFNRYFVEVTNGEGDLEKFNSDIASTNVSKKISFDMGIGKRIDIAGTPAFYVDNQYIDFGNSNGGSLKIGNDTFTWEAALTSEQFDKLIEDIANSKLSQ
ncbi:MAG: thioredoxin domain-containing protein [Candidatus Saccharibacteria bacterium]|nr:thioredoxin domain-containing protein [Candidatus Saccharibacteria bacterium]